MLGQDIRLDACRFVRIADRVPEVPMTPIIPSDFYAGDCGAMIA